jgi:hypothetical protein
MVTLLYIEGYILIQTGVITYAAIEWLFLLHVCGIFLFCLVI